MMVGLIFGCVLGLGLAYMLETLNPTFRRPEEIEQLLGPQVLAAIPDFRLAYGHLGKLPALLGPDQQPIQPGQTDGIFKVPTPPWRHLIGYKKNGLPPDMTLVARSLPTSVVAEQYRIAATRISQLGAGRRSTIVAVTSAVKGEGKTTTLVNLGYTLARDLEKRTLLVECDLKCPVLHTYAKIPTEPGLIDLLNGETPVEACFSGFGDIPCWVMPVGRRGNKKNELFKTQRLSSVLTDLRERFDYILLNTPPILPLADMNVLAGLVDLLILVVRAGSTPQQVTKWALETLRVTTPSYVILNAVDAQTLPYYIYDYHISDITAKTP